MNKEKKGEREIRMREINEQVGVCYLPILKAKRGELRALTMLKEETKNAICPVIELIDGCRDNLIKYLKETWKFESATVYLDPYILLNETNGDFSKVDEIFSLLRDEGINAIPVIRADYPDNILESFKSILFKDEPLSLRVTEGFTIPAYFDIAADRIKSIYETESNKIHLIIDYSFIDRDTVMSAVDSAITLLTHIAAQNFLTITIAAGSFIKDLSDITPDTIVNLTRWEWNLRAQLQISLEDIATIRYADYATRHPIYEYDSQPYAGSSSIRYTTDKSFLIFRGQLASIHPDGMGQYHNKCNQLIRNPYYDGPSFSLPDAVIGDCANRLISSGNLESWVKISTARHIEKVVDQLT